MQAYKIDQLTTLIIHDDVYNKFAQYYQVDAMPENGGILLGEVSEDLKVISISDITEPNRYDRKGRFFFIRNREYAQRQVNKVWEQTNGTTNYLGEWHTHPETTPIPSCTDRLLIKNNLKNYILHFNFLFMIIVGNTGKLYVGYQRTTDNQIRMLVSEE